MSDHIKLQRDSIDLERNNNEKTNLDNTSLSNCCKSNHNHYNDSQDPAHQHHEHHSTSESDQAMRKMIKISIICFLFLLAEVIGGLIANSLAILTDAAHLSSDLSGFVISIIAIYIGKKKPNKKYTFGYYRAEVIGALISVITIWLLTGLLIKEAIDRFINPSEIYAPVMLLTALLGLVCNLAMMKVLHSGPGGCHHGHHQIEKNHNHSNGHDHSHNKLQDLDSSIELCCRSRKNSKDEDIKFSNSKVEIKLLESNDSEHKGIEDSNEHNHHDHHEHPDHSHIHHGHNHEEENVNIRAAIIHIIGDIIQSVGVVIASLIIFFEPKYVVVDPLCTFVFSIIVIFTTVNITKQCLNILMESSPTKLDRDEIIHKIIHEVRYFITINYLNLLF
jgi:zinc transporter 2